MSVHLMFQITFQFGRSHTVVLKWSQSCTLVTAQLAQVGQHCRAATVVCLSPRCSAPWTVAFVYWNVALYLTYIYRWKSPVVPATFKSSDNHDSPSFANLYSSLSVMTRNMENCCASVASIQNYIAF